MNRRVAVSALFVAFALAACGADGEADRAAGSTAASRADTTATTQSSATAPGTTTARARQAQPRRGVRLVQVGSFSSPVYVTAPPGDRRRIMVVEQAGRIMVVRGGRKLARPFLDIRSRVTGGGEQGLLSVA